MAYDLKSELNSKSSNSKDMAYTAVESADIPDDLSNKANDEDE